MKRRRSTCGWRTRHRGRPLKSVNQYIPPYHAPAVDAWATVIPLRNEEDAAWWGEQRLTDGLFLGLPAGLMMTEGVRTLGLGEAAAHSEAVEFHENQLGKPDMREAVEWVFQFLDARKITARDAPSSGAWSLLLWVRASTANRAEFYKTFASKLMHEGKFLMGKRGPPRTPTNILEFTGSHRAKTRKRTEPTAAPLSPDVIPDWLTGPAREYWPRLSEMLASMGILTVADVGMLGLTCQAWADYDALRNLSGQESMDQLKIIGLRQAQFKDLKSALQQFGLTPSSRSGVEVHIKRPNQDVDAGPGARQIG